MNKNKSLNTQYLSTLSTEDIITLLDSINDAIFIDDEKGNAMWINKASEELYKIDKEEICGKHVSYLEEEGIFSPSVARLVMEQKTKVNVIHQNKEGKRLLSTGIPIFDKENKIKRIITTSRDITELMHLQDELESMQSALKGIKTKTSNYNDLVAQSEAMSNVVQMAERLADVDSTILITGESGSGKGVIAKLMHEVGNRKKNPFVKINCGAIPDNLLESELFGYESGAFTGSRKEGKKGLFEVAQNGTIFLDEISELPLALQVKLLQVIQEKEIQRVGGVENIPVNVRIISASNKDLHNLVLEGKFREDLYYRLNVVPITIPPLRERPEDIIQLLQRSLQKQNIRFSTKKSLDSSAMAVLVKYHWPGNVRELQNIIERLVITTKDDIILTEHLPSFILESTRDIGEFSISQATDLKKVLSEAEKQVLTVAVARHKTTREIAKALGVSQPTIVRKLNKYKIKTETE